MFRADIINTLIKKINAKKYLEIGVSNGINFASIECAYKVGVDPELESPATVHLTSDSFFEKNQNFWRRRERGSGGGVAVEWREKESGEEKR